MGTMTKDKLYTVAEAAELLQVSTKTLRRWTRDGIAHAMRTPTNHRRFTLEEIERLMPKAPETTEAE